MTLKISYSVKETALGTMLLASLGGRVTDIMLDGSKKELILRLKDKYPNDIISKGIGNSDEFIKDLAAYLDGDLQDLSHILVEYFNHASEWRQMVWDKMRGIPYGETITYQKLGETIEEGRDFSRAVGTACSHNDIAILVPCHRVVSSDPKAPMQYRWGAERKKFLLDLEQQNQQKLTRSAKSKKHP